MERLRSATNVGDLATRLDVVAKEIEFHFHALVDHGDLREAPPGFFFLQNYPAGWGKTYKTAGPHQSDPTRRLASLRPGSFA